MNIDRLKSQIDVIRTRIPLVRGRGEEATKQALVLPMLDALGFDIWNPSEVCPEFDADFAIRRGSQKERVDLAVILGSDPRILFEVKSADTVLDNHQGQLSRYFNALPSVSLAVLTNGIEYRFFTDTTEPNLMDPRPFHVANIEAADFGVEVLARFHKSVFSAEAIRGYASDLIYTARLVAMLRDQLDLRSREPSDELVRWILGVSDIYEGRLVASVVDRFRPLVKQSLQVVLRDIVRRSVLALDQGVSAEERVEEAAPALAPTPATSAPPEPSVRAGEETGDEADRATRIVTTERELQAFEIVKGLFDQSPHAHAQVLDPATRRMIPVEIAYKDTSGYFSVYLNKPSWWLFRLNIEARQPWLGLPVQPGDLSPALLNGLQLIDGNAFAASRVALTSVEDLRKAGPLLNMVVERFLAERMRDQ